MRDNGEFIQNYANSIQLSGLVSSKPKIKQIKGDNGEMLNVGSFILKQNFIGHRHYRYTVKFVCYTRSKKVLEELQSYNKQVYITCLGKLDYYWNDKVNQTIYYPLIEEINVESICPEDMR